MRRPALALAAVAGLAGCFNSSSYTPVLYAVTSTDGAYAAVPTGSSSAYVVGYFLAPGTTVYWDGRPQVTKPWNATRLYGPGDPRASALQVELDAEATRIAGSVEVTAKGDDTLMSAPFRVSVVDAALALTAIDPPQIPLGAPSATLSLTGTGFVPTAQVFWNDNALPTTFSSSTSISAAVPQSLLTTAGDAIVEVRETSCYLACRAARAQAICTVGAGRVHVLESHAWDVAWDTAHSTLFGVFAQSSRYLLMNIDPATGALAGGLPVDGPAELSVSAGDQFLYVAGSSAVTRYALPALVAPLVVASASAAHIAAAPGAPGTAAFVNGLVRVADDATVRSTSAQSSFGERVAWGADTTILYGVSYDPGVHVYAVDATGVTRTKVIGSSQFGSYPGLAFDADGRRIYTNTGETFDEAGIDPRPLAIPPGSQCELAIDATVGKVFYACSSGMMTDVRSFDLQTQRQISRIVLSPRDGSGVIRVVRWGIDGLAIAVGGRVYLYSGQFVQ